MLDQLFPRVPEKDEEAFLEELSTDIDGFVNYHGVEENDEAAAVLRKKVDTGCLRGCDSIEETRCYLGSDPVLSKLGVVTKERNNPVTGVVSMKTRIILDNKESNMSLRARRTHRSTLPRATHAIHGALGRMASVDGSQVILLVADVQDAFWLIPLAWEERRYVVCKSRGKYFVFTRTAQGSRGPPLTWAAVAALVARRVQSVFVTEGGFGALLQMYVDDPLLALKGLQSRRCRLAVRFLCVWLLLGFQIAFSKASYSQKLVWIGVQLDVRESELIATIPPDKAAELLELTENF